MLDNEIIQKQAEHIKTLEATIHFLRNELYVARLGFEKNSLMGHAWLAEKGVEQSILIEGGKQ